MDTEQLQCSSCHTSHKKPYDADPTKSYPRGLRRYDAALGYWVYWRGDGAVVKSDGTVVAAAFDEALCLSCHGLDTTDIARVGGATAYANSAGDHSAGYDTAATAHGPDTVRDDPLKPATAGPQVPCTACHNKHASAAANLIDYRTSNTQTAEYDESGLCFECHVDNYVAEYNGGVDWKSNSANAFFAWNGRNVRDEFARASHHPTSAVGGYEGDVASDAEVKSTQDEFLSGTTRVDVSVNTADGNGSVELAAATIPIPRRPYLYSARGAVTNVDSYRPEATAFNTDFTPAANNANFATGASAAVKNGYI
ncbi:hypothetical protein EG835_14710, partial [bacterium]|nr:hypothetical protein [bacterium]